VRVIFQPMPHLGLGQMKAKAELAETNESELAAEGD
jgi:hypothetical protein